MASADQQIEPTNPEFPLLSIRFIDSLSRIKSKKPLGRNQEINCARKIKIAAYASMAAGKNRKWSRALLRKQKTRKTKKIVKNRPRRPDLVVKQEDKLRKLVPGGEEMEICSLIDETGLGNSTSMAAFVSSSVNPNLAKLAFSNSHASIVPLQNARVKLHSSSTALRSLVFSATVSPRAAPLVPRAAPSSSVETDARKSFHGHCYVVRDNIDTDQIIPAEYLTLVPSNPGEYEKLGSYALIGLPETYTKRFVEPGETKTKYPIIIGGDNFGCGSSREHAPVALGAAGARVVVAESYARIFFRNAVATGEIYPCESEVRICEEFSTGDVATVELDLSETVLINHTTGKEYKLKPIGDAGPVIDAGGIFAYARMTGMIPSAASA